MFFFAGSTVVIVACGGSGTGMITSDSGLEVCGVSGNGAGSGSGGGGVVGDCVVARNGVSNGDAPTDTLGVDFLDMVLKL